MRTAVTVALALAAALGAAAGPALAADQATEIKALKEQVKSLQDANVVMKEDLAKTQLQLSEMATENRTQEAADKQALSDLQKELAEIRQALADERAAHEAELQKAQAEAARQRRKAKDRQMWLYILGGLVLAAAASS